MSTKALARTRFTEGNIKAAISYISKKEGKAPHFVNKFDGFKVKDGELYYFQRKVVPPKQHIAVIRSIFDDESKPKGMNKLEKWISDHFVNIPSTKIRKFVRSQHSYQMKKIVPLPEKKRTFIHSTLPGAVVEIDCMFIHKDDAEPNAGTNIICNAIDRNSRYFWSRMLARQTAAQVKPFIQKIINDLKRHGFKLKVLYHDNGTEFVNDTMAQFCKKNKVKQQTTRPYQPAKMVEKANGDMRRALTAFQNKYKTAKVNDWIPEYVKRVNSSQNKVTKVTPLQMLSITGDERFKVNRMVFKKKQSRLTKSRQPSVSVGDKVRISTQLRDKSNKIGHSDTKASNWSKLMYIITRIVKSTRGQSRIYVKGKRRYYFRGEVQLIHSYEDTSRKTAKDRPQFGKTKLADDEKPPTHPDEYVPPKKVGVRGPLRRSTRKRTKAKRSKYERLHA